MKKEAKQREEEELALLFGHMSGGAAKTKAKMEALEEEKRKAKEKEREAAGDANVWIDQVGDMIIYLVLSIFYVYLSISVYICCLSLSYPSYLHLSEPILSNLSYRIYLIYTCMYISIN